VELWSGAALRFVDQMNYRYAIMAEW